MDGLVKMGFRSSHVNEALDYCSDTASALDWLCKFHSVFFFFNLKGEIIKNCFLMHIYLFIYLLGLHVPEDGKESLKIRMINK